MLLLASAGGLDEGVTVRTMLPETFSLEAGITSVTVTMVGCSAETPVVAAASEVVPKTGVSEEGVVVMIEGRALFVSEGLKGAPYPEACDVAETGSALLIKDVVADRALDLEILG